MLRKTFGAVLVASMITGLGCAAPASSDDEAVEGSAAQTQNVVVDHVVLVPDEFTVEGSLIVGVGTVASGRLELRAADRKAIRSIPVKVQFLSVGAQAVLTASGGVVDEIDVENWEGRRISELLGGYYGIGGGITLLAGITGRSNFSSPSGVTLGGYGLNTMSAGLGVGIAAYRLSVTADGDFEDLPLAKGAAPSAPTFDVEVLGAKITENETSRALDPFGGKPDPAIMVSAVANDGAIWSNWTSTGKDTFTPRYQGKVLAKLTEDALAHVVLHMQDGDLLAHDGFGVGCITRLEIGTGTAACNSGTIPFEVSYRVVPHQD